MKTEIFPKDSKRAEAFRLWMSSPMPMVTLMKTFDVSKLVKYSKRKDVKFNALMCWCIGKAATEIKEFYVLPDNDTLYKYDKIAVNVIVANCKGDINSCDIPYSDNLTQFYHDYLTLTAQAAEECKNSSQEDSMIIGTSAMPLTELDCIVNQYSGRFNNPFLAWGKYRKGLFKTTLPVSFQFHHVQMDGGHACLFLNNLQKAIDSTKL